jgi:hypothetical protein
MNANMIYIEDLPRECIENCGTGPGDKSAAVDFWLSQPAVAALMRSLDPNAARQCLKGYGAWDETELADDGRNLERVLWLACGDFAEYISECKDAGIDPFGERPEDFDPHCGSDIFCLE